MIDLEEAVDGKGGYLTYLAVIRAAKRSGQRMTAKAAKQVLQKAVADKGDLVSAWDERQCDY